MAKARPCYLGIDYMQLGGSMPDYEPSFCESVSEAQEQFRRRASTSRTYGDERECLGYIYFVDAQGDDFDPSTPDRRLKLSPKGVVQTENC